MRDEFLPDRLGVSREDFTESLHKGITRGVKWEGIGIPDPNQTSLANFYMSNKYCEFLTASLINRETMYLRLHYTQVKEGCEAGKGSRVDME